MENDENEYTTFLNQLSNELNKTDKDIIKQNYNDIILKLNIKNNITDEKLKQFIYRYIQSYKEREILSSNLKRYMSMRKVNVTDVANKLDLPHSTVNAWYNGVSYPRVEKIQELADILGVTKSDLTEPFNTKSNKIPVLGRIPAGIPIEAIEDIFDYEEIPESWLTGDKEFFGLLIDGNSMLPDYKTRRYCYFSKSKRL